MLYLYHNSITQAKGQMMAVIQKLNGYMVLFDDQNKLVKSEEIPISGKTLILEVKLQNLARNMGMRIKYQI